MLILGLTGPVAAGKTTASRFFAEAGIAAFSADAAVHRLYAGRAAPLIEAAFPGTVRDGAVDRARLSALIAENASALAKLEAIVHPIVREEEAAFLDRARRAGRPIALLEVPLLFETGADARVDIVIFATAPEEVRRARALARPGMDAAKLALLQSRRLPAAETQRRSHFRLDTGADLATTASAVAGLLRALAPAALSR